MSSAIVSMQIEHDAPPGGFVASTTVLSPTTGLSFDVPLARRLP